MTVSAGSTDILTRLRQEARPSHDALEANEFNQALTAGTISEAATARFLAKLYGFVVPFEEQLRAHSHWFGPEWELERRFRSPLLRQDLPAANSLPLAPNLPPLHTRAQLLGALYVLEGSTLGGQVIARQLAKNGIPTRAYFSGHAEQTGPLWKSFVQLLAAAATPETADEIIASASLTFQRLHQWIEQA
ncbi:biliverdin-producing heme oxygenase [Hymenobacter endophyticus]|uniref:Biliverdin-producing heme oxygenase n=1 Tax=Hymenobacter endophyticus TaxID=3076335 RepID=A0ABU3TKL2_9BACT|nr:biliverdin-producing heme oxygenase [Hymenobacter endophyticus]MDU0371911.1 biliverdin-producing heme oxygenase [Hymenobacter endophyticus]